MSQLNKQARRRRKKTSSRSRQPVQVAIQSAIPPMVQVGGAFPFSIRLRVTAANFNASLDSTFFGFLAQVSATAILANSLFSAFKLKKIVIYSAGVDEAATLKWAGVGTSQVTTVEEASSDAGTSVKVYKPPRNSNTAFWFTLTQTTQAYVNLTALIGTLIDVHLTVSLWNSTTPSSRTTVGATPGQVYYSRAVGATSFTPEGGLPFIA